MVDVYRECDVVEEILRIYGYNNVELPRGMRSSVTPSPSPDPEQLRNYVSNFFSANGFNEIMNNSLTKLAWYEGLKTYPAENCVPIVNPLSSDLGVMRESLIPGALEVAAYNINRQIYSLRTFEFGSVYQKLPDGDGTTLASYEEHQNLCIMLTGPSAKSWSAEARKGSYFQLKGYVELLLSRYGADIYDLETEAAPSDIFSEGQALALAGSHERIAIIGTVNPAYAKRFDVKQPVFAAEISWPALLKLASRVKVKFSELPKFPEVRRDLALLLDEGVDYASIRRAARKCAGKLLKGVSLFDVYRGEKIPEGKKQYAVGFVFQNPEKTLTDSEIENVMNRLLEAFRSQFGATLR